MAIEKELLDQLLAGRDPQELFSKDGLVDELKKALSERILNTELDAHLGSEVEKNSGNHRNGVSKKSMLTGTSKVTLDIPRDRAGKLVINQPPRSLKSICVSVPFVAWCLGHDPGKRFAVVSYSSDLASKFQRDFRTVVESGWYKELFPAVKFNKFT